MHDIHAYFCGKQKERTAGDVRSTRLVGFKWKPLLLEGAWDDAFRWLGDHREVRVVHLRRNPLDVMISGVKHARAVPALARIQAPGVARGHANAVGGGITCLEREAPRRLRLARPPTIIELASR